jgi:synaptobrevin family protein YKT6
MVKLYAISVLRRTAGPGGDESNGTCVLLKGAYDLQSVGFFQRGSVQEFLVFTSNMLVERTTPGARRSVKEQGRNWNLALT